MEDLLQDAERHRFPEIVSTDLKLDSCQWEERPPNVDSQNRSLCLEIDCLVHDDWLSSARLGCCTPTSLPPVCHEEIHWLLQPSCDSLLPISWQRVHISCIKKQESGNQTTRDRYLVPQCNDYSLESIHEFLTQVAQENLLVSWRETLESVQPHLSEVAAHKQPSNAFVRQLIYQLYNVEVKRIVHYSTDSNSWQQDEDQPQVHMNLTPLLAAVESRHAFYFIFPYTRFSLFDAAMHSPAMFDDSVAKPLFVLFQFLKLLSHVHSRGITLGEVSLRTVFVDTRLWVQVRPQLLSMIGASPAEGCGSEEAGKNKQSKRESSRLPREDGALMNSNLRSNFAPSHSPTPTPLGYGRSSQPSLAASTLTLTDDSLLTPSINSTSWVKSYTLPVLPLSDAVRKWRQGELSNFDYLMLLNHHAGRVIGDPNNHPIFPWVMDFTHSDTGFRDLSKSKHFLTKGEDQLNFTYYSAVEEMKQSPTQDPLVPHHIGDISSDVTYYVYLARKTPKQVLCSHVRPRWVPEEYPVSMEKMYIWSPDECIPEFYADSSIFKSIHPDLCDLQVPQWALSPENFIRMHRNILEGDIVSSHLHHWIDLVFGYKLTGHDAVKAKNVYLSVVDKHKHPTNSGIVQLFKSSHPKRNLSFSAPHALQEWSSYLHRSSVMNVSSFSIEQAPLADPITPRLEERSRNREQTPEAKTLESILSQESAKKRALPEREADIGPHPDLGHENQEEDFYGSFEHVNLPNLSLQEPSKASSAAANDPRVNTGDLPQPEKPVGSKVKSDRDSIVMTGTTTRFRMPVVDRLLNRQRRAAQQAEGEVEYDWQTAEVSLPKEARLLDRLTRLEELSSFVSKSCKDEGDLFPKGPQERGCTLSDEGSPIPSNYSASHVQNALKRVGEDPFYFPSLEERMGMDVTAVTCTVVEMCCVRQLRAATPANATLLQRVGAIKKLLKSGKLKLPTYLLSLVDFVLSPETPLPTTVTHLPSFTPTLLLQPFLPVITFPSYFEPLYKFIHSLEQLICQSPLGQITFNLQKLQLQAVPASSLHSQDQLNRILEFISANLDSVLKFVSNEGFRLLLLHLFPFFVYPDTSFDAVFSILDPLAQRMSRRNVERLFSLSVIRLFDTATEPHQRGQLLCRTTADLLIRRFGLSSFLTRFLGFFLEAVLEPFRASTSKPSTAKRVNANIMRMQSQSVLTLVTSDKAFDDIRGGRGRNADLSFSLALSDAHHGYDSDKDDSSDESDGEMLPEASILAKSGMYLPSFSLREHETDSASGSLAPLTIDTNHLSGSGSAGPSSPYKPPANQKIGSPKKLSHDHQLNFDLIDGKSSPMHGEGVVNNKASLEYSMTSDLGTRQGDSGMGFDDYQKLEDGDSRSGSPTAMFDASLSLAVNSLESFDGFRERRCDSFGTQSSLGVKSSSIEQLLSDDELDGVEEEDAAQSREVSDPVTLAINAQIADMAADSLCWLIRRLGPLLATQHIVRPLLDGLHRCYTGVVDTRGRQGPILKCLSSFVEFYGSETIQKLLIPRAENMVTAAMGRMSTKTEAGVAASLALIRIAIKQFPQDLLENISKDLCDNYFVPLIQLLSSQTSFPSRGEGRAAISRSMVDLLVVLGERLGREEARQILSTTLQCFFSCFSSVHSNEEETQLWSSTEEAAKNGNGAHPLDKNQRLKADDLFDLSVTPTERSPLVKPPSPTDLSQTSKVFPGSTPVDIHPLSPAITKNGVLDDSLNSTPKAPPPVEPLQSEAYIQVCATFSQAMAHAAYIPFCRLLGQHHLNSNLYNTDLIEHIAYKHDAIADTTRPMSTVLFTDSDIDSEVSSVADSDSEDDVVRDASMRVGPVSAVTGLGKDEAGFGKSSWFVTLQEDDKTKTEGVSQKDKSVTGLRDSLLSMFRSSSDSQLETKPDAVGYFEAAFDVKFSGVMQQTTPLETPVSTALGKGMGVAVSGISIPTPVLEKEERDCTLKGQWSHIWEKQLHRSMHAHDSFGHFRGVKLQTFAGHKSVVRSLAVSDNEQVFVSTSKDKTAKIWKLGNHGDGSSRLNCCLTYSGHSKTVIGAELMEGIDQVVSCDGSVHVWDIETGYSVQQFQPSHGTSFSALETISSSQPVIAVATNPDLHLRFIDLRTKSYMHRWKLQFPTGGTLRCLACADNWIAVGNYNGQINTLDVRTGELLSSWKPFDVYPSPTTTWNDSLLQLKPTQRGNLIASVGTGVLSLWRPTHGQFLHPLRCPSHPYHCLEVVGEQMVSVSSNGYLTIHDRFETNKEAINLSTRIRNRGVSALAALKENHLLLLGSDNGLITLMT